MLETATPNKKYICVENFISLCTSVRRNKCKHDATIFTSEVRILMIETYLRTNSTNQVINEFVIKYPDRVPPEKTTIFITSKISLA